MKINIINMDTYVKEHNLKEVTNPVYFNLGGSPTEDGLFSYEIFGEVASDERKNNFAYIDLHGHYLHPVIYRLLTTMDKKIANIINGTKFYKIVNGELMEDEENGQTGVNFLYNNFENIKFRDTGTTKRTEKLDLLKKLDKDTIFLTKFLVIPAFYRDVNTSKATNGSSKIDVDAINEDYVKLLRLSKASENFDIGLDFINNNTQCSIQNTLLSIYLNLTGQLSKKTGLIHQALIGKTVDYATRSVISTQKMNTKKWNDIKVPFGSTGVPITQVCVLFYPFLIKEIHDFIELYSDDITSHISKIKPEYEKFNLLEYFTEQKIKKLIDLFIKNTKSRFEPITFEIGEKIFRIDLYKKELQRSFTLMDLLYICCSNIVKDKHVYVTRYPVATTQSIYPSRIFILTTNETMEMALGDLYFKDYPVIYKDYPVDDEYFIDTTIINQTYCTGLNADFDGDTVSLRAVFTVEANREAEKLINNKMMFLDSSGHNLRQLGNECIQSLFTLTS